jgi:CO/xanthine dehydrogenase FAD-binding subunit
MRDGIITHCRIGLASVAHSPLRCVRTEAVLKGARINTIIAEARAALLNEMAPIDDIRSTAKYRAYVGANLLEEFLNQLSPVTPT